MIVLYCIVCVATPLIVVCASGGRVWWKYPLDGAYVREEEEEAEEGGAGKSGAAIDALPLCWWISVDAGEG